VKTFPRPVRLPQRPRAGAGAPGESAGARRRSGGGPGTRIELQVTYIRLGFAVLALGILSPWRRAASGASLQSSRVCSPSSPPVAPLGVSELRKSTNSRLDDFLNLAWAENPKQVKCKTHAFWLLTYWGVHVPLYTS
jgi:hypothetical protein